MELTPLDALVIDTNSSTTHTIIWLHGLGADGNDFQSIVPELGLPKSSAIRFIFPHAPIRPVTINNGMEMRAWYDLSQTTTQFKEDKQGVDESNQLIQQIIDAEIERGIESQHIILAGFSQGGAIALYAGLHCQHSLAGVIALSAYMPIAEHVSLEHQPLPMMMAHGTGDEVVRYDWGIQTKAFLEKAGYTVDWYEYPMEHQVCRQEIADISAKIQQWFSL